jgi:hypothetical protein
MSERSLLNQLGGRNPIPVPSLQHNTQPHKKNGLRENETKSVKNTSQLYKNIDLRELMEYYNHRTTHTPSDKLVRSITALREYSRTIPYTQFIDEIVTRYPHILLEPGNDDHINLSDPYCDNNTQRNSNLIQFLGSIRTAYDINDIFNTK